MTLTKEWKKVAETWVLLHDGFNVYIRCYARYTNQSVGNNTTTVEVEARIYNEGGTFWSTSGTTGWATIGGQSDSAAANRTYGSGETTVAYKSRTIEHEADGTKSINVSARWKSDPWGLDKTAWNTVDLPKIDRIAVVTEIPNNINDESEIWFKFSNPLNLQMRSWLEINPNGPHLATRTIDNPGTSGTYTYVLTAEERNQLRAELSNATTGTIRIGVYSTISGTQYYSYKDTGFIILTQNPTLTYTNTEANPKVSAMLGTTAANSIVQNASIFNISVTPTAYKQATVSKVTVTYDNKEYIKTSSPYSFSIPMTASANFYQITVTDSRGNSGTVTVNKSLYFYEALDIKDLSFERVNPTSSNITLHLEATYYPTIQTAPVTTTYNNQYTIKWKLDNGSWTTVTSGITIDGSNHKITVNTTLTNALVYTSPGTFTLLIEDLLSSDQDSREVLKGIPTYDAGEHDFNVNGDLTVSDTSGNNTVNILDKINSILGVEASGSDYVKFKDGTAIVWGSIRLNCGTTKTTYYSTVNLPITFKDTNYKVNITPSNPWGYYTELYPCCGTRTTTTCQVGGWFDGQVSAGGNIDYIMIGKWK